MARTVIWTKPAWEDLEAAADFIAKDSKAYAAAFLKEIKEAATSLSYLSGRGQIVPEFNDSTIREFLVKPYRLIYKITDYDVYILTVVHGSTRSNRR